MRELSQESWMRRTAELLLIGGTLHERRSVMRLLGKLKPEFGAALISTFRDVAKDRTLTEAVSSKKKRKSTKRP